MDPVANLKRGNALKYLPYVQNFGTCSKCGHPIIIYSETDIRHSRRITETEVYTETWISEECDHKMKIGENEYNDCLCRDPVKK